MKTNLSTKQQKDITIEEIIEKFLNLSMGVTPEEALEQLKVYLNQWKQQGVEKLESACIKKIINMGDIFTIEHEGEKHSIPRTPFMIKRRAIEIINQTAKEYES